MYGALNVDMLPRSPRQAVCSGGSAGCEGLPVEGGRSDCGEASLTF